MLRTSRRKERAARRRTQRGGATIKITESFINRVVDLIKNVDKSNLSEAQLAIVTDISNNKLSAKRQQALKDAIREAPSKMTAIHFTNPVEGSIEKGVADTIIINTLLKIETPSGNNTSSQLEDQSNDEIQPDATERSSAEGGAAPASKEVGSPPATAPATTPSWYKIPEERKGDWLAAVSTLDISSILVPLIESGNITSDAYIEVLARQNDLFKLAFDIIRGKVTAKIGEELQDAFTLVDHAKDISDTLMEYINDVEKLILKSVEPGNTKLGSIRSRNENIFELLLFPDRLQNLLIKAVANICVMLADDKNYNLVKNKELLPLLIKQYSSYAEALAYSQTAVAMRDGYYLSQDLSGVQLDRTAILSLEEGYTVQSGDESLTAFWKDFIVTLYELAPDGTELFKTPFVEDCDKSVNGMSWGQIAANICMMYKRKMNVDKNYKEAILEIFDGSCNLAVNEEITGAPPMALWGERLTKIFTYIRPDTLEFMLHLAYEITRAAKRAPTEAAHPTSSEQAPSSLQGSGV